MNWQTFTQIADRYKVKATYQDREDLRQDIILRLAELASTRDTELSKVSMLRVASYVAMEYWHQQKRLLTTTSLNEEIDDGEGNTVELWETLADDKAIDLDRWIDAKTWLAGCPKRLVSIAYKKVSGKPLNTKERMYLSRYRYRELAKAQKALL